MRMGIRCEWADLNGTGIDGEAVRRRARELDRAAVATAGFATALDREDALPAPTAADRVVVLGIGGSALGARCVHEATRTKRTKPIVVVDNIDPEALEAAWHVGDPARTCWVAVSKSGGTTETLAQLADLVEQIVVKALPGFEVGVPRAR